MLDKRTTSDAYSAPHGEPATNPVPAADSALRVMPRTLEAEALPLPKLLETVEKRIVQRTQVRIPALDVAVVDGRIVIRGRVPSYYLKQLVLQAVLDVVGSPIRAQVELNVDVAYGNPN